MKCLVTGAAGFIGSHLVDRLLRDGHQVVGIDCFVPYYARAVKETNLGAARHRIEFHELDLRQDALAPLLGGVEAVFHLAAMPGLPLSWTEFDSYLSCNVTATQRLLEVSRTATSLRRFVYVSTSSVYGKYASGDESLPTRPVSPYGVTKLAAEHLCRANADEFGLPVTVLRYFSVYGPRQRPDMGYHRFIEALLQGKPITVYGDGLYVRGCTFIDDCVEATIASLQTPPGETLNVGGGETVTTLEVLARLESIIGRKTKIMHERPRAGEQRSTFADTSKLRRFLDWQPRVGLDEGLRRQVQWHKEKHKTQSPSPMPRPSVAAAV